MAVFTWGRCVDLVGGVVMIGAVLVSCRSDYGGSELQQVLDQSAVAMEEEIVPGCGVVPAPSHARELCDPVSDVCEEEIPAYEYKMLECVDKDLRHQDLSFKIFRHAALSRTDLTGAMLRSINLRGFHGDWARFDRINGEAADFSHGMLVGASFEEAHLEHAKFVKAHLLNARFVGAHLKAVDFHSANLRNTDFSQADLRAVKFQQTYLHHASFRDANLRDADFTGAHVEGVDFRSARHLETTKGLAQDIVSGQAVQSQKSAW